MTDVDLSTSYAVLSLDGARLITEEEWCERIGLTVEQHRAINDNDRRNRRELVRVKWPIVGFWLIEWLPRLDFQRRIVWEIQPWSNGRGTSYYVRLGPFFVSHWGNGDPNTDSAE